MTFNGTDTEQYGMVVRSASGGYDMPSRAGNVLYDWGDEYEPLFGTNFTAWNPRSFTVRFLFDRRRMNIGMGNTRALDWVNSYGTDEIVLGLSDASGAIGFYNVSIVQTSNHRIYNGTYETFTMLLQERVPVFNGTLPVSKAGGSISLDGYSFSQVGCRIVSATNLGAVGNAQSSVETTYLTQSKFRTLRALNSVELKMVLHSNNPIVSMASLQAILSQEKTLPLVAGNYSFNTLCVSGFEAERKNAKTFTFNLNLLVL